MSRWIKQSTAITVKMGPFVDSVDGNTVEGSLTLSQGDFRLSKNGGDFAQKNESSAGTHDEIGYYDVALDTTDTNTLGRLLIAIHESGALPVWAEFMVVPANVWDSLFGADALQVHAVEISNDLITAAAIADNAIDAGAIASDAITAAKIAADAIGASELAAGAANEIADALLSRGVANVEDTADTTSLAAIILAILESEVIGTTWRIYKTTGGIFVDKTVTPDPAAVPIKKVT